MIIYALRGLEILTHSFVNITLGLYIQRKRLHYSTKEHLKDTFYTMIIFLCFLSALVIILGILLWRRLLRSVEVDGTGNVSRIRDLRTLKSRHEIASILSELVDKDGAGAWPPKANHDSWPMALRPYKDIYLELVPLLPAAKPSLDDDVNNERRSTYRSLMRKLLTERVNITQVEPLLAAADDGKWDVLSRDAYNGFYACVAVCRHAYR